MNAVIVARCAAELDRVKPGWETLVDIETLCIFDSKRCILGQVFREEAEEVGASSGYDYALDIWHHGSWAAPLTHVERESKMVASGSTKWSGFWSPATKSEWIELINDRRGVHAA